MKLNIPHQGTQAEGIAHIKRLLEENRQKIAENAAELKESWNENVLSYAFRAQGQHIEGTLTVRDKEFELYAKLPLALRLFEGTIERMIESEVKKLRM